MAVNPHRLSSNSKKNSIKELCEALKRFVQHVIKQTYAPSNLRAQKIYIIKPGIDLNLPPFQYHHRYSDWNHLHDPRQFSYKPSFNFFSRAYFDFFVLTFFHPISDALITTSLFFFTLTQNYSLDLSLHEYGSWKKSAHRVR